MCVSLNPSIYMDVYIYLLCTHTSVPVTYTLCTGDLHFDTVYVSGSPCVQVHYQRNIRNPQLSESTNLSLYCLSLSFIVYPFTVLKQGTGAFRKSSRNCSWPWSIFLRVKVARGVPGTVGDRALTCAVPWRWSGVAGTVCGVGNGCA